MTPLTPNPIDMLDMEDTLRPALDFRVVEDPLGVLDPLAMYWLGEESTRVSA